MEQRVFSGCESFHRRCKTSHIQNLEVNKVGSTKQVSEAGNHDVPQRALTETTHAYTALFNHSDSRNALNNFSKGRISLPMSNTSWLQLTVHNTCKSRLEGLHTGGESVLLRTSSDRCCERPFRGATLTGADLKSFQMNGTVTMSFLMFNLKERRGNPRKKSETKVSRQTKAPISKSLREGRGMYTLNT